MWLKLSGTQRERERERDSGREERGSLYPSYGQQNFLNGTVITIITFVTLPGQGPRAVGRVAFRRERVREIKPLRLIKKIVSGV